MIRLKFLIKNFIKNKGMSKNITLWEYINYYDTALNKRFREEKNYISKLTNKNISSKTFLNLYKCENDIDLNFLKRIYNEYFDFIMGSL